MFFLLPVENPVLVFAAKNSRKVALHGTLYG